MKQKERERKPAPPQARISLTGPTVPSAGTWLLHQLNLNQILNLCSSSGGGDGGSRGLQQLHPT